MSLDNKEITLNFIEDYRSFEVLWNPKLREYRNKDMRGEALQEMSIRYQTDVNSVKNKIKSLRSYFCKEHHKAARTNENYVSNWFAYKHLLFLADGNVSPTLKGDAGLQNSNLETPERITDEFQICGKFEPIEEISNLSASTSTHSESDRRVKRKRKDHDYYAKRNQEVYESVNIVNQDGTTEDEYSVFGAYIGHKIRKLRTQKLRAVAQNRISNLLFEIEMSSENE
ncbi:hypothetical protein ANN_16136, partial [Periplaneta americana]